MRRQSTVECTWNSVSDSGAVVSGSPSLKPSIHMLAALLPRKYALYRACGRPPMPVEAGCSNVDSSSHPGEAAGKSQ